MPDSAAPAGTPQSRGPLAGLLVADFSRILAGPYATMLLADLGAEVVKVEAPAGDDTRSWQPPVRDGVSTYFLGVNRNKRSVALDLKDRDDLSAAQELARRADIMVENFRPGGLARFGKSYIGEPDALAEELAKDAAIAEADTLLVTVPNQLGVDYNARLLESIVKLIAPAVGWR